MYKQRPREWEQALRGRQVHQRLPFPGLGEKPPHDEAAFLHAAVLAELGDRVPVRRPVPVCGPGEEAEVLAVRCLPRAVDVRKTEHLAAERVADEAHDVRVQVEPDQLALAVRADDGSRGSQVHETDEEEAVAARAVGRAPEHGYDVAVGVGEGLVVDEVAREEEAGHARGFGKPERRSRSRRSDEVDARVDHRPRRARGDRGEAAAKAAGDGGGETNEAAERHPRGAGVVLAKGDWCGGGVGAALDSGVGGFPLTSAETERSGVCLAFENCDCKTRCL